MKPEYENVCNKCSETFIADSPETFYCPKCWAEMVADQIATDTKDSSESD